MTTAAAPTWTPADAAEDARLAASEHAFPADLDGIASADCETALANAWADHVHAVPDMAGLQTAYAAAYRVRFEQGRQEAQDALRIALADEEAFEARCARKVMGWR